MEAAIQELIETLRNPEVGWLVKITLFMGVARTLAKPVSAWLQNLASKFVAHVQSTPEKDDDSLAIRLFSSKPYRVFAFLCDYVLSLKLPNSETLKEVNE